MKQGRDVVLDVLGSEGVRYIFGNPGTTELSLIDAIMRDDRFEYVLGLQESSVLGMADGYARATNRPSFVNLHASAGLGHAMGALTNAAFMNTPLVVTAGQQDYRHIVDDPWLSGDLVSMAKPFTKWAHEIRTIDEIGTVLRRAFKEANTCPKGPVFISLPFHFMDMPVSADTPAKSCFYNNPVAEGLEILADHLSACSPNDLAIVACDEISSSEALEEVVDIASILGCDVLGAPVHDSVVFPTLNPQWVTMLPPDGSGIRKILKRYSKVFIIGDKGLMGLIYSGLPISKDIELLHLSADSGTIARTYTTTCGVVGDIKASLRNLEPLLKEKIANCSQLRIKALAAKKIEEERVLSDRMKYVFDEVPMQPEVAAYAISQSLPKDAIVVDEAPSVGGFIRKFFQTEKRLQYNFSKGGGLGWGMPAAVGIALSEKDKQTFCIVGDGAAMYSPQVLWTAVNEELPITFIVTNNSEYGVLKNFLRDNYPVEEGEKFIAMDVINPAINFISLAESFGLKANKVSCASEIDKAISVAVKSSKVNLIEIVIAQTDKENKKFGN